MKKFLSPETKEYLQQALKEEDDPQIRERVLILLLLNARQTQEEVAEIIGCSVRTVAYWWAHANPENLDSLKDKRMSGNNQKATPEYVERLLDIIEKEPEEYGYEFGRWTTARLANHLEKEVGIKLSSRQVDRILKAKKYVYIWAKYSLEEKQDPEKRKLFKQKLAEYLAIAKKSPQLLQIWFWDETGFSLRVIRRKNWCRKGTRRKKRGDRRKGRINVMGGLRYSDRKRWVDFIEKGNNKTFYAVMKNFHDDIKKEWIEQGNLAEDFREKGCKILVILDNASFHKNQETLNKIAEEMPNLIIEFLPEYSPDYNLVELVWHSAKEYIAGKLFESTEELEALLHELLNEGELVINWNRKIKNKGNSINAV